MNSNRTAGTTQNTYLTGVFQSKQFLPAYSLTAGNTSSAHYYLDVSDLADHWISIQHPWLEVDLETVRAARVAAGLEPRSFDEIALELLALGVALHEHARQATKTPEVLIRFLRYLIRQQEVYPDYEKVIKSLRGLLSGLFYSQTMEPCVDRYSLENVRRLNAWLQVQGGEHQAARFAEWSLIFERAGEEFTGHILDLSQELTRRFLLEAERYLGCYVENNSLYRVRQQRGLRWRYDAVMLQSSRLEYYLGMLGTEILNRVYRQAYRQAENRLVILPPCICAQPEGRCHAVQTPLGAQCTACTPGCRVNQITVAAARKGVPVVMIPDDELGKLCVSSGRQGSGLGVVGVACALRNWSAGWEARRLGLNAQGILLDYPGCSKHWDRQGLSTDLNVAQLLQML